MPFDFKLRLNNFKGIERAARRRVLDYDYTNLTEEATQVRINKYLESGLQRSIPQLLPGSILGSGEHRNFLKDYKFYVSLANEDLLQLGDEVLNSSAQSLAILLDLQREAEALNSLVTEEEIKTINGFDTVHFNGFVRPQDMALAYADKRWLVDFKTNFTFLTENMSNVIVGTGITLPVREKGFVPIVDVVLIGEETDVGDTRKPIVSTDPRNVFLPDRTFRYVIIRKAHDYTSRKFNQTPSYCTLQLELPNIQLLNFIEIDPVGQSPIVVDKLSLINEAGEEVVLNSLQLSTDVTTTLLFEPSRMKYLKVRLQQYAPVTKTHYLDGDLRVKEINKALEGVGFSQLLPEDPEDVQGRVYDFSIHSIRVGLLSFEPTGVFRSNDVDVTSPLGLSLSEVSGAIRVTTNSQRSYGLDFVIPDGSVLNEYYAGINLKDSDGNTILNDLIPIPDSYPTQREYLPIVGRESRLKFFPDMLWDVDRIRITDSTALHLAAGYVLGSGTTLEYDFTATTETPHQFKEGESIVVTGPFNSDIPGEYIVTSDHTLPFVFSARFNRLVDTETDTFVDEATLPRVYAYKSDEIGVPLFVYKEQELLTIGVDYEISFNNGSTWLSEFPRGNDFITYENTARAGNCRIRLNNPSGDKTYWVEYRPLRKQYLGKGNLVTLNNGTVVFNEDLRPSKGTVNTVIISRSENTNQYVTPVVLHYSLKVREDVS